MRKSEQTDKIVPELIKVQMALETVPKKGENPHFKNRYVELGDALAEAVPKLNQAGLFLAQTVDQNCLLTTLLHTSGQWIESAIPLINKKGDDQGQGGSITYAKRYGLLSILGIPTEDDDGNVAAQPHKEPPIGGVGRIYGKTDAGNSIDPTNISEHLTPKKKWADYVLKTGKTKGETIKSIGIDGAMRYGEWLQNRDTPPKGAAKEDLEAIRAFQQECADANPMKVFRGNAPPPTQEYEAPTWKDEEMPKFEEEPPF